MHRSQAASPRWVPGLPASRLDSCPAGPGRMPGLRLASDRRILIGVLVQGETGS
jgi:hypothetical protein